MAWHDWGNLAINGSTPSTGVADPSTTTLVVELDSTVLGTANFLQGQHRNGQVSWFFGGSTTVLWTLEQVLSTGLGSTAVVAQWPIFTPTGQTGQYVTQVHLEKDHRLRARVTSSLTGTVAGSIHFLAMT